MKFDQTCPCGSEIHVDYAPGNQNMREAERRDERNEARKLIDQWRTAHRPCLRRLDAAPAAAGPDFDVDEHDDLTEDRLLERLERFGLLREGDTALSVRDALNA